MGGRTYKLTTSLPVSVPGRIEVAGEEAYVDRYEDEDGDYLEYQGYPDMEDGPTDWTLFICFTCGYTVLIRASIDGDEVDSTEVDIRRTDDLTDIVKEMCDSLEKGLKEYAV